MAKITTEQDWLKGANPGKMLGLFGKKREFARKLRLFGCACCRRVWGSLSDDASRNAVVVAEQFADKLARQKDLKDAALACGEPPDESPHNPAATVVRISLEWAAFWTAYAVRCVAAGSGWIAAGQISEHQQRSDKEAQQQGKLLHDIFGNPFRPVTLMPSWKTPTVVALATAAYENRILPAGTLELDRLAVLADALEEAGCDNADILNHCRQPGVHVRGCWVLDLMLGKD